MDWFTSMNNTGGDVDVWAVDGVDEDAFLENPDGVGFFYVPCAISADRLTLMRRTYPPTSDSTSGTLSSPPACRGGLHQAERHPVQIAGPMLVSVSCPGPAASLSSTKMTCVSVAPMLWPA